jgi:predicted kinase
MKTMILMQGIPGSGKSTMVDSLCRRFGYATTAVCSTDDFWYDENKVYRFDSARLGAAHQWNQDRATLAMKRGETVIVDNTNIKREHVAPYLVAAAKHGYEVQVVRVAVDPTLAVLRQEDRSEDRRVPAATIFRMHREMEDLV